MSEQTMMPGIATITAIGRSSGSIAILPLKVAVLVAEILLVAHAVSSGHWQSLVLGHLAIIGCLTLIVLLLEQSNVETGSLQSFVLLTFAGGPIGGAAALMGDQLIWRPKADALERWYNTVAPAELQAVTLVDMIIDGRLVQQQSRLPRPYDALLSTGTMQEKQALLAYLAIEDDEKFVEIALALALRSSDQRVRVQAAAVAAHTRARARRRKSDTARSSAAGALPTSRKL
jgi:hypothetical protein